MRSLVLRVIVVLIALGSWAGAAYKVWDIEVRTTAARSAADTFERQARQLTMGLAELRGALQAYVADGQNGEAWHKTAALLLETATGQVRSLRDTAHSPEGQGAIEDAVEQIAALAKTESRAREYLTSSQRLSASDVVFAEAAPQALKAADAIDMARGQEAIAAATAFEHLRLQQLYLLAAAASVSLIAMLLLVPLPRRAAVLESDAEEVEPVTSGLGLSHVSAPHPHAAPAPAQDEIGAALSALDAVPVAASKPDSCVDIIAVSDLCVALARVQEPRELPALLERAAAVLNATGIVVWMPDPPSGHLRPALAHGYPPLAITRMGIIPTDADNATAVAFRTQSTQMVPAEGVSGGAVAAPLVTGDGCSGVMAAELRSGSPTDEMRAVTTMIAAQLATLISPTPNVGQGHL